MSQHHGASHDASHGHDDHHEAFDPEPPQELGADETPSPSWLPIAGGALLLVAVGYVFYPGSDAVAKAPEAAAPAKVAPAVTAQAAAAAPPRRPAPPGSAKPSLLPRKGVVKKVDPAGK